MIRLNKASFKSTKPRSKGLALLSCIVALIATAQAFAAPGKYVKVYPNSASQDTEHPDKASMNAMFRQAQIFLQNDDADNAIPLLDKLISADPTFARFYYVRGRVYSHMKHDLPRAAADFERAAKLDPTEPDYYASLGWCQHFQDKSQAALENFSKAIELRNRNGNVVIGTSESHDLAENYWWRSHAYRALNQPAKRIADLSKALELGAPHENTVWRLERAKAYLDFGQKGKALKDYTHIRPVILTDSIDLILRGDLAWALEFDHDAVSDYNVAKTHSEVTGKQALSARGDLALNLGFYKDAIADYDRAIQKDPRYACVFLSKSWAQLELGEWRNALNTAQKSVSLQPKHADHFSRLAYIEECLGLKDDAKRTSLTIIEIATAALKKQPDDVAALVARSHAYRLQGKFEDALKDAQQAAKINADYASWTLARINRDMGNNEEALRYYKKAMRHTRSNCIRYDRMFLLKRMGRSSEAATDQKALTDAHFTPPTSH